jgi:DNA-binding PadR family transcriptional regulator
MPAHDHPPRPEAFLPLHPLEFQILLTLVEGSAHAYAIVRSIEERQPEWSRILPTNLYRRIWRLEAGGLLVELEHETRSSERRRKYFGITDLGRRVAAAEAARLRDLLQEAGAAGVVPAAPRERAT